MCIYFGDFEVHGPSVDLPLFRALYPNFAAHGLLFIQVL